ncbi:MAG: TPM domain-containing protein [Hymenobacter sp.]
MLLLLLLGACLRGPVVAQSDSGLPARPVPFTFVTDQGNLMQRRRGQKARWRPAQLRRKNRHPGSRRDRAQPGRPFGGRLRPRPGHRLGVGQRGKNNGIVVLLSAKEHQVSIQPGSGWPASSRPPSRARLSGRWRPISSRATTSVACAPASTRCW